MEERGSKWSKEVVHGGKGIVSGGNRDGKKTKNLKKTNKNRFF